MMTLRSFVVYLGLLILVLPVYGQRLVAGDTLYGNEWIRQGQAYIKLAVVEEGFFELTQADLAAMGWGNVTGADLKLTSYGEEQAMWVSTDGAWTSGDRLVFYSDPSSARRYEVSHYVGVTEAELLNPKKRVYSDSLYYYLSIEPGSRLRYTEAVPVAGGVPETTGIFTSLPTLQPTVYTKVTDQFGGSFSSFRAKEGYGFGATSRRVLTFLTRNAVDSIVPKLTIRTLASIVADHRLYVFVEGDTLYSQRVPSAAFTSLELDVSLSKLQSGNSVSATIGGALSSSDRFEVGLAELRYSKTLVYVATDTVNRFQAWRDNPGGQWRFQGLPVGEPMVSINLDKGVVSFGLSDVGALYNQADAGDKMAFALESQLRKPVMSSPGFGSPLDFSVDYYIITSRQLDSWSPSPQDWAAYRSSILGGSYRTGLVYVEDLYEQFGYGEPRNAAAIQAAISYLYKQRGGAPHVLLLGKGREFQLVRFPNQRADVSNATNYVPTLGKPGADNLLAFNPLNKKVTAYLGRIAVGSEDQLAIALEKVRQADDIINLPQTLEDRAWTKKLIHLVGGRTPSEQAQFKAGMDNAAAILEESEMGAFSTSFYKDSNTPIQQADSDQLFEVINDGSRLLTFFGHGSQNVLDFNIDNPDRYSNVGRLPVFFALGCYTGNVHTSGMSIGERFLLQQEENSLAFAASTGLGYPSILFQFLRNYYTQVGRLNYGTTLGEALSNTYAPFLASSSTLQIQFVEQFTLQGDPAISLSVGAAPDYVIDEKSIRIDGGELVASEDTLRLNFLLRNLGRTIRDTVDVKVEREAPKLGRYVLDTVRIVVERGISTGSVWFLVDIDGGGLNNFYLTILDNGNQGPTPAALNNDALGAYAVFFADNSISLTYPSRGAKLISNQVICYGQGGSFWDSPRIVEWELSDNKNFTGPQTVRSSTESTSLASWDVTPYLTSGKSYFVRLRSLSIDSTWRSSFFTWNPQETLSGFRLDTEEVFSTATGNTLNPTNDGEWEFSRYELSNSFRNKEYISVDAPSFVIDYGENIWQMQPWVSIRNGIGIFIIDSLTGEAKYPSYPGRLNRAFGYPANTQANREIAVKLLDSIAQHGDYIFFMSCYSPGQDLDISPWFADTSANGGLTLVELLRGEGASKLELWRDRGTVPYTLIYRKGMGLLAENVGETRDDVLFDEIFLDLQRTSGVYKSVNFPPLASVKTFTWEIESPLATDTLTTSSVRLVGEMITGDTLHLASSNVYTGATDLSSTVASSLTSLRFEVEQSSPDFRRPLKIKRLDLTGEFLPEVVFDPEFAQVPPKDSLDLGELLSFDIGVRNLSEGTVARNVVFSLTDLTTRDEYITDTLSTLEYGIPLSWNNSLTLTGADGNKELFFRAGLPNPAREIYDQNALAFRRVFVKSDGIAPLVRILFDGELLKNNDILPPQPTFLLEAKDFGNQYNFSSTASVKIRLTMPDGVQLSGTDLPGTVSLVEHSTQLERASWMYEPGDLPSGIYKIAVEVEDITGNTSNTLDGDITFEIENAQTISRVLPYPNPMVDRVKFQYELTGSVPEDYQIDIYSVSGRLVRSLGPQELGPLKIGRRLTELAWNGTTETGEKLAAGTYLYRFSVSGNDKAAAFEARETAMDQYVKSGFGKLVILP